MSRSTIASGSPSGQRQAEARVALVVVDRAAHFEADVVEVAIGAQPPRLDAHERGPADGLVRAVVVGHDAHRRPAAHESGASSRHRGEGTRAHDGAGPRRVVDPSIGGNEHERSRARRRPGSPTGSRPVGTRSTVRDSRRRAARRRARTAARRRATRRSVRCRRASAPRPRRARRRRSSRRRTSACASVARRRS